MSIEKSLELNESTKGWQIEQIEDATIDGINNLKEEILDGISLIETNKILLNFQNERFNKNENTPKNSTVGIIGIQAKLHFLGFNPGKIDGLWGPQTRKALAQFQMQEMYPNGEASQIIKDGNLDISKTDDFNTATKNIKWLGWPGPQTSKALLETQPNGQDEAEAKKSDEAKEKDESKEQDETEKQDKAKKPAEVKKQNETKKPDEATVPLREINENTLVERTKQIEEIQLLEFGLITILSTSSLKEKIIEMLKLNIDTKYIANYLLENGPKFEVKNERPEHNKTRKLYNNFKELIKVLSQDEKKLPIWEDLENKIGSEYSIESVIVKNNTIEIKKIPNNLNQFMDIIYIIDFNPNTGKLGNLSEKENPAFNTNKTDVKTVLDNGFVEWDNDFLQQSLKKINSQVFKNHDNIIKGMDSIIQRGYEDSLENAPIYFTGGYNLYSYVIKKYKNEFVELYPNIIGDPLTFKNSKNTITIKNEIIAELLENGLTFNPLYYYSIEKLINDWSSDKKIPSWEVLSNKLNINDITNILLKQGIIEVEIKGEEKNHFKLKSLDNREFVGEPVDLYKKIIEDVIDVMEQSKEYFSSIQGIGQKILDAVNSYIVTESNCEQAVSQTGRNACEVSKSNLITPKQLGEELQLHDIQAKELFNIIIEIEKILKDEKFKSKDLESLEIMELLINSAREIIKNK